MKARRCIARRANPLTDQVVLDAALVMLRDTGGVSVDLLCQKLHASSSTITPILARLRSYGRLPASRSCVADLRHCLALRGAQVAEYQTWSAEVLRLAQAAGLRLPPAPLCSDNKTSGGDHG